LSPTKIIILKRHAFVNNFFRFFSSFFHFKI